MLALQRTTLCGPLSAPCHVLRPGRFPTANRKENANSGCRRSHSRRRSRADCRRLAHAHRRGGRRAPWDTVACGRKDDTSEMGRATGLKMLHSRHPTRLASLPLHHPHPPPLIMCGWSITAGICLSPGGGGIMRPTQPEFQKPPGRGAGATPWSWTPTTPPTNRWPKAPWGGGGGGGLGRGVLGGAMGGGGGLFGKSFEGAIIIQTATVLVFERICYGQSR